MPMSVEKNTTDAKRKQRGLVQKEPLQHYGAYICIEMRKCHGRPLVPVLPYRGAWTEPAPQQPGEKKFSLTEYLTHVVRECSGCGVQVCDQVEDGTVVSYQTFVKAEDYATLWTALVGPLNTMRIAMSLKRGRGVLKPELVFGANPRFYDLDRSKAVEKKEEKEASIEPPAPAPLPMLLGRKAPQLQPRAEGKREEKKAGLVEEPLPPLPLSQMPFMPMGPTGYAEWPSQHLMVDAMSRMLAAMAPMPVEEPSQEGTAELMGEKREHAIKA